MKKYIQAFIIIAYTIIYLPASTEQIRQLFWDDLIPAHLVSENPLANLTEDQQGLVYWVISTLETGPERGPDTEVYYKEFDEALLQLKKDGIDIDKIMAKRKEKYNNEN